MVIIIYYTDVLKEYLLPSLVDADYEIRLEKELYGFHKDLYLKMESTKDGWSFLPGLDYDIYKDGKCCGSILVHDQDLLEFYTQEGRRIQAMISDTGNRFPVMKKFDISACSEILFGSNPANHIVYQYMGLVSKYHGMLYRGSDGWYLEDSSRNGIFCGNRRVYGKRRLVFGEVIHVFGLHLVWLGNILAVDCAYGEMELHQEKSRPMEPVQDHSRRNKETSETDYYHRSPRSFPPLAEEMIKIEGPPSKPVLKQKPLGACVYDGDPHVDRMPGCFSCDAPFRTCRKRVYVYRSDYGGRIRSAWRVLGSDERPICQKAAGGRGRPEV